MKIIDLEGCYLLPGMEAGCGLTEKLSDLGDGRVADMDKAGVDIQVLIPAEVGGPIGAAAAAEMNRAAAAAVRAHPDRFRALAVIAPGDPGAADELKRCMNEEGFLGWCVPSNFGSGAGPDDEAYLPLIQTVAEAGGYLFLQPARPVDDRLTDLGPVLERGFGYGADVCVTALRMICKGIFDRFPQLKLVLGHYGNALPAMIERMDAKVPDFQRVPAVNKQSMQHYFTNNILVTTSGNFNPGAFACARDVMGIGRVLFASGYPAESAEETLAFLKCVAPEQMERLCAGNAAEELGIVI